MLGLEFLAFHWNPRERSFTTPFECGVSPCWDLLKWIVELEKPFSPSFSPEYRGEYRGKGEKPTIQRLNTRAALPELFRAGLDHFLRIQA
jgi:hypothetical protein